MGKGGGKRREEEKLVVVAGDCFVITISPN